MTREQTVQLVQELILGPRFIKLHWDKLSATERTRYVDQRYRILCVTEFDDALNVLQDCFDKSEKLEVDTWAQIIRDRSQSKAANRRTKETLERQIRQPAGPSLEEFERMKYGPDGKVTTRYLLTMDGLRQRLRDSIAAGRPSRGLESLLKALGEDPEQPESRETERARAKRNIGRPPFDLARRAAGDESLRGDLAGRPARVPDHIQRRTKS